MHYDPEVFDDPKEFRPERFLTPDPTFPRSAYRPFERGLRSCMGQTLAMDEMKIALLMLARWFDFELRDHNPVTEPRVGHTNLDTILGDHAFQNSRFTAGPNGDVIMKVKLGRRVGECSGFL
jgi:cytochrome P450